MKENSKAFLYEASGSTYKTKKKEKTQNKTYTSNKNEPVLETNTRIYLLFLEGYHVVMAITYPV